MSCKKIHLSIDKWQEVPVNSTVTLPAKKVLQYSIICRTEGVTVKTESTNRVLIEGESVDWADKRTSHETPYVHANEILVTTNDTGTCLVRWTTV